MDFVKLAATVVRLIDKNGRTVTFQALVATAADASKPWEGPASPAVATTVNAKGVFVPASGEELGRALVSEELLARVDEVALVAPNATDLEPFNVILDGGVRWRVEWVKTLKPADQVLLYVFGVCR
jgi:hypothetical protein